VGVIVGEGVGLLYPVGKGVAVAVPEGYGLKVPSYAGVCVCEVAMGSGVQEISKNTAKTTARTPKLVNFRMPALYQ